MYRYGWPFSNLVARLGARVRIKIEIVQDSEAGVYVATSPDLDGLVLEAESLGEIMQEAEVVIPELLRMRHAPIRKPAHLTYDQALACA